MAIVDEIEKIRTDVCNIPSFVLEKLDRNLHLNESHPVGIIVWFIRQYFKSQTDYSFTFYDNLSPIVSVENNFDKLLIKKDHPSRRPTDTYYINNNTVLRTHMTAHQPELLSNGSFLAIGDVYRKDTVDRSHYYVFHQIDGVGFVPDGKDPLEELKRVLSGLVEYLFPGCNYRFNEDYFPFTHSSLEIEVEYEGKWLEILGAGVTKQEILDSSGAKGRCWAFGIGLERLCMLFFKISDIRYFWTADPKFTSQFKPRTITTFEPYSSLDTISKDISFYIKNTDDVDIKKITEVVIKKKGREKTIRQAEFEWKRYNDFCEWVRGVGCDYIESMDLGDSFSIVDSDQYSQTFRIKFSPTSSMKDPAKLTEIANTTIEQLRDKIVEKFNVELR